MFKSFKMEVLILRELRVRLAQVLRLRTLDPQNASGLRNAGKMPFETPFGKLLRSSPIPCRGQVGTSQDKSGQTGQALRDSLEARDKSGQALRDSLEARDKSGQAGATKCGKRLPRYSKYRRLEIRRALEGNFFTERSLAHDIRSDRRFSRAPSPRNTDCIRARSRPSQSARKLTRSGRISILPHE